MLHISNPGGRELVLRESGPIATPIATLAEPEARRVIEAVNLAEQIQVPIDWFPRYNHAYVMPGERFPRRAETNDPATRDVRDYPYSSTRPEDHDLIRVGDIFSDEKNPGRKRAFDMRTVMSAVIDADHRPLERWTDMRDAENVIVWDAHVGGYPVAIIGIESRPIPRRGFIPADGPEQWAAGTLYPMASKKAARTINSASGNRPLGILTLLPLASNWQPLHDHLPGLRIDAL